MLGVGFVEIYQLMIPHTISAYTALATRINGLKTNIPRFGARRMENTR